MKIIHVIDSLGIGGAELLLCNTIRLLPDHQHVLITLTDFEQINHNDLHLEEYISLNSKSKKDWPRLCKQLRAIIRRHNPDLVHTHLQLSSLLVKTACPKDIPLFYTLHSPYGPDGFSQNRFARLAENMSARPYHHIIGVSKLVLDDYSQYVRNFGTTDVLYNFVPDDFFKLNALKYSPFDKLRCISIGSLKRAKNYPYTLQQFALLKNLPITLDIYGSGDEHNNLQKFIEEHQLTNVRLMGRTDNVREQLGNYNLYLITSSYEGFGLAPLEAMAAGLPVVVSDIPVFREVIGAAGIEVGLRETDKLSEILTDILEGRIDLQEYIEKGTKRAKNVASASAYKENLLRIYNKYLPVAHN